ncbi:MAG: hypothetical protein L0Y71_21990, partial [Gemmataceae bacterium]|nr:hypothetical protein [Gemmataceae bacterium]
VAPTESATPTAPAAVQGASTTAITAPTFVVGPDAGGQPLVKVFDVATRQEKLSFLAYNRNFSGGVRVATADFTGDGVLDILTGPGPGGGSQVRVFNGTNGRPLAGTLGGFNAYAPGQTDGVFVAAGDVSGDGVPDIITGTNDGAAPLVKVFSGAGGALIASFNVSSYRSTSGVRVAAGDVTGDGIADIITGEGPGGLPRVCMFDGPSRAEIYNFFAYEYAYRGGIYVAAGDTTGDGKADIIVGPGAGHAPEVRAFHGADTAHLAKFLAFDATFTGGVRVTTLDADRDGKADIAAAAGPLGNQVRLFDGQDLSLVAGLSPYGTSFRDGLFVGGPAEAVGSFSPLSSDATVRVAYGNGASEPDGPGVFGLLRDGDTSGTLIVFFSLAGTATNGTDYQTLPTSATFPPGQQFVDVDVLPIDDALIEGTETVILTLQAGAGYTVGNPASGTIPFADDETGPPSFPPAVVPPDGCG